MDCRGTLALSLALALAVGAMGCSSKGALPVASSGSPIGADVLPETELPKKAPRASTCVAWGIFFEKSAVEPNTAPARQEFLRDQARRAYQQALAIDPSHLQAHLALARLYMSTGQHERAMAAYDKALKAHPKEAGLWFELGMCHARQKQWEPALRGLHEAVKLDPENPQYNNHYGFCLARAGRFDESLAAFRQTGSEAEAHYKLAQMLNHLGQQELCKQHLQVALQKEPRLTEVEEIDAQKLLAGLPNGEAGKGVVPVNYQAEPSAEPEGNR